MLRRAATLAASTLKGASNSVAEAGSQQVRRMGEDLVRTLSACLQLDGRSSVRMEC